MALKRTSIIAGGVAAIFTAMAMAPPLWNKYKESKSLTTRIGALEATETDLDKTLSGMNINLIYLYRQAAEISDDNARFCQGPYREEFAQFTVDTIRAFLRENSRSYLDLPKPVLEMPEGFSYEDYRVSVTLETVLDFLRDMEENDVRILRSHSVDGGYPPQDDPYDSNLVIFYPDSRIFNIRGPNMDDAIHLMGLYKDIKENNFFEGSHDPIVWLKEYEEDYRRDRFFRPPVRILQGVMPYDNGIRDALLTVKTPCPEWDME